VAVVTLLTDFGSEDSYVGAMKGVILALAPDATIIDLTHNVPAQNILSAAYLLKTAYSYFPPGTIHLCVVDPGVGTARRALALVTGQYTFLAPDNGVLTWVLRREQLAGAYELNRRQYFLPTVSDTFHGRDVFASVAGHLARGVPIHEVGSELPPDVAASEIVQLELPSPHKKEDCWLAHIVHVDRFGNLITDFEPEEMVVSHVVLGDEQIPFARTYGMVPPGSPVCVIGGFGHLEVAISGGNAAQSFGASVGDSICVYLR